MWSTMCKWKAAVTHGLLLILISDFVLSAGFEDDYEDQKVDAWGRCPWIRNKLKNGKVRVRSRGRIAKFSCKSGFELVGRKFATCVRGQWNNPIPFCVATGCSKGFVIPNGSLKEKYSGAQLTFDCNPGYSLFGDSTISCDGTSWDKEPPKCQVAKLLPPTSCDFEDPDLCGWTHDPTHHFDWKRNQFGTPSGHVGTGPSYDHTYGKGKAGFYMYEEASAPRNENDTSRLFSPVYSRHHSPGCFVFWYHMYGATTGGLRVYMKPESHVFAELNPLWEKHGDQGNQWLRGNLSVPLQSENFQIVIEGIRGPSYVGDTAIDDVSLVRNDCSSVDSSNSTENAEASEDSCRGRCHERDNSTTCGCSDVCESNNTCCSDYSRLCAENIDPISGDHEPREYSTTSASLETDTLPELTAVEKVGTEYTVMPPILYTESITRSVNFTTISTNRSTQQASVTQYIPMVLTASASTKVLTQMTQKPTIESTRERTTTAMPQTSKVPDEQLVSVNKNTAVLFTTRNTSIAMSTEPTTTVKLSTVPNVVPPTTMKASTVSATQTKPESTAAALTTTKALPVSTQSLGSTVSKEVISESTISYVSTVTGGKTTLSTMSTSSTQTTVDTRTAMVTSRSATSPTLTTEISNTISSTQAFVLPVFTQQVSNSTSNTSQIIPEALTSKSITPTDSTSKFSISSSASPYATGSSAQITSTKWKTLTSSNVVPTSNMATTSSTGITFTSTVFPKVTKKVLPVFRKTIYPKYSTARGSTLKNTGAADKLSTKPVPLFHTTQVPLMKDSSTQRADAHASKSKTDTPQTHRPSVIGISIGVILSVGLVGGVAYVFLRRWRRQQNKLRDDSEMRFLPDSEVIEYSDATALDQLVHS